MCWYLTCFRFIHNITLQVPLFTADHINGYIKSLHKSFKKTHKLPLLKDIIMFEVCYRRSTKIVYQMLVIISGCSCALSRNWLKTPGCDASIHNARGILFNVKLCSMWSLLYIIGIARTFWHNCSIRSSLRFIQQTVEVWELN